MKNKYLCKCARCKQPVLPNEGFRQREGRLWVTVHGVCPKQEDPLSNYREIRPCATCAHGVFVDVGEGLSKAERHCTNPKHPRVVSLYGTCDEWRVKDERGNDIEAKVGSTS